MVAPVRINGFHCQNVGADQNEFIKIRAAVGTAVTGEGGDLLDINSNIIGFNSLTSFDKKTDSAFDCYVWPPSLGLLDDAVELALSTGVNDADVMLFDSIFYGGALTGMNFLVNGAISTDAGVTQSEVQPVGSSIQRSDDGAT